MIPVFSRIWGEKYFPPFRFFKIRSRSWDRSFGPQHLRMNLYLKKIIYLIQIHNYINLKKILDHLFYILVIYIYNFRFD